ncbi:hypothetical protein [Halobacillus sp. Nhm2S1]|uniref:hypothetical protein n=1 Tax=Halobacillus sp. Nhm2S1 TaxID=2866716 RepID=UPI001C72CCD9|nr:hypothetical protein [Halobacillus sp. Nhm2S1]MBX0357618.1 hypothetical protein [Halobacillus sp. Nhm2S1]
MKQFVLIDFVVDAKDNRTTKENRLMGRRGANKLHPDDAYAVEEAVRLKTKHGGKVTILFLAEDATEYPYPHVRDSGVDETVWLKKETWHEDVFTTASMLSEYLKEEEADLILTASDIWGTMIAELLEIPSVTRVLDVDIRRGDAFLKRKMEEEEEWMKTSFPLFITPPPQVGEAESTFIKRLKIAVQTTEVKVDHRLKGEDSGRRDAGGISRASYGSDQTLQNILVVGEIQNQRDQCSYEAIAAAERMVGDGEVTAVLMGEDVRAFSKEMMAYGADGVLEINHPLLENGTPDSYAQALFKVLDDYSFDRIVFPDSPFGRELSARAAVRMRSELMTGVTEIERLDGGVEFTVLPSRRNSLEEKINGEAWRVFTIQSGCFTPGIKEEKKGWKRLVNMEIEDLRMERLDVTDLSHGYERAGV